MQGMYLVGLERHGYPYLDEEGRLFVSLPEALPHQIRNDTRLHVVTGPDETLFHIALSYNGIYRDPLDLAFVIGQFQPNRIVDPSVPLPHGMVVMLPSPEYINEFAYGESLSEYPKL